MLARKPFKIYSFLPSNGTATKVTILLKEVPLKHTHIDTHTETHAHTETCTHRDTHRHTHTHTDTTHTQTQTHTHHESWAAG